MMALYMRRPEVRIAKAGTTAADDEYEDEESAALLRLSGL